MQGNPSQRRCSVSHESFTGMDIPDDIFMCDISADKTRMAVICKTNSVEETAAEQGQERYMLRLYDLPTEENGKKAAQNKEFKEEDVSFIAAGVNPIYIFLSTSGQTGLVTFSFIEMNKYGQSEYALSDAFSKCYIYGNNVSPSNIPFQGRAVFVEANLVLVGLNAVDIYNVSDDNVITKGYTLDTEILREGYEETRYQDDVIHDLSWAKFLHDEPRKIFPVASHEIITLSRHINSGILVKQYTCDDVGSIVRIWSIHDGALLTSYKSKNMEHAMAISDNYIATYDEEEKVARIYCMKTGVVLHKINAQTDIRNDRYILTYMRFFGDGRHLIISGYTPDPEQPTEYRNYYFEVWCVPAQKWILTDNTRVYYKSIFSPFIMEFRNSTNEETTTGQNEERFRAGHEYRFPDVKVIYPTRNSQNSIQITERTLFKQDWVNFFDNVPHTWKIASKSNTQESTRCEVTLLKSKRNKNMDENQDGSELYQDLNKFKKLLCYSIQIGTDYYMLRFGLCTVQLWRLKEMDPNTSEQEKVENGFWLGEGPCFFKSMEKSDLVYMRAYRIDRAGFTFKDNWNLHIKSSIPEVVFMNETGHIYVKIEYQSRYSSDPSQILDVDEIFLPFSDNRSSTDFHEMESACRALYYINVYDVTLKWPIPRDEELRKFKEKYGVCKKRLNMLSDKTCQIIQRLLDSKKADDFFTTLSGSKTLAMLASFHVGQRILKYIIATPRIPISIFSYIGRYNSSENVLTVLIENDSFDIFNACFHRVVVDSYDVGPGNLSAIMDALLYLQYLGISELLFNCSKKLSYIPVNVEHYPVQISEYWPKLPIRALQQSPSHFRMLESFSTIQQINKYENTLRDNLLWRYDKLKRNHSFILYRLNFGQVWTTKSSSRLCVAPLLRVNESLSSTDSQIFKQGDTVMEIPIQYKWKLFARARFFWILVVHIIYYICYTAAVTFPQELYHYESIPQHPGHFVSIVIMFLSGIILLLQEFREFRMSKMEYITSFYNWIDLAAFFFPTTAFGLLLTGNDLLRDVDSIAILILWTHAILRLRVFRQFGFILEIIIQLSKKIMPIIGIMMLVVFAFTHAFIARLRLCKDEFFQEQFQGGATDDDGNPIANATLYTMYDVSSSNNFSNVFRAFSMVWFFIFGIFDPISDGDVGDDIMTIILAILFSFVTVLFFSNMVIALMSSTVEDVKSLGNRAWYFHFATVVAEVETLWCTSRQRYDRKNNPTYIYYVADFKTVKTHVESMRDETNKLIEELKREDNHRL